MIHPPASDVVLDCVAPVSLFAAVLTQPNLNDRGRQVMHPSTA